MDNNKAELARQLLEQASASLAQAKQLLSELTGINFSTDIKTRMAGIPMAEENAQIIEGVFDGKHMADAGGKKYPVPENYASKSKLVEGDRLKLTIAEDGAYLFKQIGPIDRRHLVGTVVLEGDQYKVIAEGRSYNVLTASITYYKLAEGDKVTATIPAAGESQWAAIESAVIA